mmetsp:Transcript_36973/g.77508  ORF Transcript_36973/g.77508 Transcript_36973/m.77508 type:complete len:87 (+) Transcript_36973:317-577(+)
MQEKDQGGAFPRMSLIGGGGHNIKSLGRAGHGVVQGCHARKNGNNSHVNCTMERTLEDENILKTGVQIPWRVEWLYRGWILPMQVT